MTQTTPEIFEFSFQVNDFLVYKPLQKNGFFGTKNCVLPQCDNNDFFFRAGTTHRTLPAMVNRSNSLGRSLPPIPSKPPPLVRRRTFEDEDERRMDWI